MPKILFSLSLSQPLITPFPNERLERYLEENPPTSEVLFPLLLLHLHFFYSFLLPTSSLSSLSLLPSPFSFSLLIYIIDWCKGNQAGSSGKGERCHFFILPAKEKINLHFLFYFISLYYILFYYTFILLYFHLLLFILFYSILLF